MLNRRMSESSEISDAALLAAVAAGDVRAFRRFHERYHGRIYGFALRLVDRADRADEITNDTLLSVWRSAGRFEGRSRPATWVYGIAYRIAMKTRRRFRFERRHTDLDAVAEIADGALAPVETLILRHQVDAALGALGTEARAIVQLTYVYGLTCEEVAAIVGCPVGTVKSRMSKARDVMKRAILRSQGTVPGGDHDI